MSSRYRDSGCPPDCKVYVGDLGNSGTKHEIEDAFSYYGPLRNVWVARNPPGFAFVEFEDSRDARDAVRGLDGKLLCGRRVRVELSTGRSRSSFRGPPPRPFHPDDRCYDCGERGHYARDCKRVSKRLKLLESRAAEADLDLEVDLLVEAALRAILQVGVAVPVEVDRGAEASLHPEEEHDLAANSFTNLFSSLFAIYGILL
ncbi:Serine/arginine-rich splicing factor 7 [Araneus ventricosus]|uniref:Serine/arginine-rich splicing factor 7 n=1 Tax=Araneus ventricosus TaxID=182803 RepID=A0A4Y2E015_ARAVE|nr:Serine/arginine-rich splicing factor 7 [Araneus ventricosus]